MRPVVARVAARLREERQRQKTTQESLAFAARVSREALNRFETGKTGIQLDTLARLVVRGLGLNWAQFMASTGPPDAAAALPEPVTTLHLSREDMIQARRCLAAIARALRRAHARQRRVPGQSA